MKLLFENWRQYLNENRVSSDEVEAMVVDIHHNKEDFDEGNLIDRIYEYDVYEERNIPIENITSPWEVDEALVDEYVKKGSENMPPIVVDSDYDIVDGTHRFEAAKRLGLETIKAYIGVENETTI
jgi:hypothetical protein